MRRRTFIAGTVLAATAHPARTQQRTGPPRIGLLDPGIPHLSDAFHEGMRNLGYVDGHNVSVVLKSAAGKPENVAQLAVELAHLNVDVIVTAGTAPVRAATEATSSIPIVFAALGDALASGVVTNLSRPGSNLTGLSFLNTEVSSKRLEILVEAVPGVQRVAVFADPTASRSFVAATEEAAKRLSVLPQIINVPRPEALEDAFVAAVRAEAQALDVLASAFFNAHRERLVELAMVHRLPAMYESSEYVRAGGLMAYGPNLVEMFRRAANFVDRILKGAVPGELPVEQPTKFEFLINLKAARGLGLTVPPTLLARADEVIE